MSDSDASEDIPSREVCEKVCQDFAGITGTDTALAMFYLQDRAWELERALNAYFEESGGLPGNSSGVPGNGRVLPSNSRGGPSNHRGVPSNSIRVSRNHSQADGEVPMDMSDEVTVAAAIGQQLTAATQLPQDPRPNRIRLMSWNIDGLDQNNLKSRTKAVCETINKEDPDVVFLQEVVTPSLDLLEQLCPAYQIVPAGDKPGEYFTAILLKVTTVTLLCNNIQPFYSSKMGRNLLKVKAKVKDVEMLLMTSHLESTKDHANERKRQLGLALKAMVEAPPTTTVIFGGDLNLRDKEIDEMGRLPDNVYDLWEVTGKRPEAKFSWDMRRNDNLEFSGKFRPQCRFDRLYLRHCEANRKLKPVYFELIGLERVDSCKRFPSDHWGLLSHFDKV